MPLPKPRTFDEYRGEAEAVRALVKEAIEAALQKRTWSLNFPLEVYVHHVGPLDFEIHVDLSLKCESQ